MRIEVRAEDRHPTDGHPGDFTDSGPRLTGRHAIISSDGVELDGKRVILRDRRIRRNRVPGHPWLDEYGLPWTGFRVTVEP